MEKTFNLKNFIGKSANADSEGAQGYFLAQSRAWMNCSKCKRNDGKTAQQAWQECFEEFQKGDRKLSWLESYAKAATKGISKEAAIDYSGEIDILVSDGVPMQEAVMGAIKTAQAKWWEKLRDATPFGKGQRAVGDADRRSIDSKDRPQEPLKRDRKMDAQTYNQLLYIQRLISNNEFDSGSIRKLVLGIQDPKVQEQLNQFVNYIKGTEAEFAAKIDQMSNAATRMIQTYDERQTFEVPAKTDIQDRPPVSRPELEARPAVPSTSQPSRPDRKAPGKVRPKTRSGGKQAKTPLSDTTPPPAVQSAPQIQPYQAAGFNQSSGFNIVSQNKVIENERVPTEQAYKTHKQIQQELEKVPACRSGDLFVVNGGLLCVNCGGVSSDHGKTWKRTPGW